MKLTAGDEIWMYTYKGDTLLRTDMIEVKGFSALGMHVVGLGIFPFFSERNWYAGGYAHGEHRIYLKHPWLLPYAVIFEYLRLERYGRIIIKEPNPSTCDATMLNQGKPS